MLDGFKNKQGVIDSYWPRSDMVYSIIAYIKFGLYITGKKCSCRSAVNTLKYTFPRVITGNRCIRWCKTSIININNLTFEWIDKSDKTEESSQL